jgi:hypothetical protein
MKADISKEERQRMEREQWAEIRAALVRRHFAVVEEQQAVDAALFRLEVEQFQRAAPAIGAIFARSHPATVPAPVVTPEPEPVAPPVAVPPAIRPGAPDMPFDLRHHLGLR